MIVVIADDLSGAAELAGAALRHGLTAEVQTKFAEHTAAEVICLDTDTRSLKPDEAARIVERLAREIVAANPAWIFKKCDSVLRGPVVAEARAIARVMGQSRVMIVPANPSRRRSIRQGKYYVEEKLLHQTPFAGDPDHPRMTSDVAELLDGDLANVIVPDVETTADVIRHAGTVDAETLPVGALDFFEALLRIRVPSAGRPLISASEVATASKGETLLVCGSAASWELRRLEAVALGVPNFALPHEVNVIVNALRTSPRVLLGIGDGPNVRGRSSLELVNALAESATQVVRESRVARLLLEGGMTAAAVVRALGWTRLRACEVAAQGVGVLQPVDAIGPTLVIKPGSYGWPSEIWPGLR